MTIDTRRPPRDPDPVSIILATLGAVGSIASIVSLVQGRRREKLIDDRILRADRADLVESLAEAEAGLSELTAVVHRVRIMAQEALIAEPIRAIEAPADRNDGLAFGRTGLLLDEHAAHEFLDLQDQAFRHARASQKALASAFKVLYRTDATLPEEDFKRFVQVVMGVNAILSNQAHTHPADLLRRTETVANQLGEAVHALRLTIENGPDSTPRSRTPFL